MNKEIPKKYESLRDSNWNKGNLSTLSPLERLELMNLWLDYNKWDVLNMRKRDPSNDEIQVGFID